MLKNLEMYADFILLQYHPRELQYIFLHIGFIVLTYLLKQINKFCQMSLFPLKVIGKGNVISASISNSLQNLRKKHSIIVKRTIKSY